MFIALPFHAQVCHMMHHNMYQLLLILVLMDHSLLKHTTDFGTKWALTGPSKLPLSV